MFGLGVTEILVILVVALLVFGPDRLPELARNLGRGLSEFRRASSDLRRSVMEATEEPRLAAKTPPPPSSGSAAPAAPGAPTAPSAPAAPSAAAPPAPSPGEPPSST